jgi:hypothetical protein
MSHLREHSLQLIVPFIWIMRPVNRKILFWSFGHSIKFSGVKDSFGDLIHDIESQGRDMLEVWKDKSTHFVRSFLELYTPNQFNQITDRIIKAISPPGTPDQSENEEESSLANNDCPLSPSFEMKVNLRIVSHKLGPN